MTLHVAWYLPTTNRNFNKVSASVWIRCLQLLPYLEKRGIQCTVNDVDAPADIAVFVRWQSAEALALAQAQKAQGRRIVFDLCVNYFDETGLMGEGYGVTAKNLADAKRMVSIADAVTCASEFIRQRASHFHPWTEYLWDSVDRRHFCHTKATRDFSRRHLRLIWSGTGAKLNEITPVLPLLKRHNIGLTLISNRTFRGRIWPRYRNIRWRYETFPKNILEGEVCISYRELDTPYNRGHSFFKIGVFMAQGVPALAVPLPSYVELLQHGGGRVCDSLAAWDDALAFAVANRDTLAAWSAAAQRTMQPYLTENIVNRYRTLFEKLAK